MAYQKHKLSALVEVAPDVAWEQIVGAFVRAGGNFADTAEALDADVRTVKSWVNRLRKTAALAGIRRKLQVEGRLVVHQPKSGVRKACGICGKRGHNVRTCPKRARIRHADRAR